MPSKYVPREQRKPGEQYRPNGTLIVRKSGDDPRKSSGAPAGAPPAGSNAGAGAGAPSSDTDDEDGGAGGFIDPSDLSASSGAGERESGSGAGREGKRKPGRPAKPEKKKVSSSLEGIEGILLSLHTIAAAVSKVPELAIAEPEAKQLAAAIGRVSDLYDYGASERTLAWVNLAVCAGGIYGTRLFAYQMRIRAEDLAKKALPAPRPSVLPFVGSPFASQNAANT